MAVSDYNTNPALNTSISGIDIAELSSAAGYNNALRQLMADIKAWSITYAITTPVSIAQGGTGATTAAGALSAIGALDDDYINLLIVGKSAAFAFDSTLGSCGINYVGAAAAATINPQSTTVIHTGFTTLIRNAGSGALTITRGAGVSLFKNGSTTSADAALAVGGLATLVNWGSDTWTVTGSNIS